MDFFDLENSPQHPDEFQFADEGIEENEEQIHHQNSEEEDFEAWLRGEHGVDAEVGPAENLRDAAVFTLQQAFPRDGWHIDTLKNRFDAKFPKFKAIYADSRRRRALIAELRTDARITEVANLVFVPRSPFRISENGDQLARLVIRYGADDEREPSASELQVESDDSQSEPDKLMDDSVFVYMAEINKYQLLSAVEERELGRKISLGKRLDVVREIVTEDEILLPRPWEIAIELLDQIVESRPLIKALCQFLGMPLNPTLSELINRQRIRIAIDGEVSTELLNGIGQPAKEENDSGYNYVVDLSMDLALLPLDVVGILGDCRIDSMDGAIGESNFQYQLQAIDPMIRAHFQLITAEGERAKAKMTESNLKLVLSVARRYAASGMPILDLVQEGNLGLMRAVDRFDYRLGFRFSTYSTWWIRQSITRGIADTLRVIRLPVHVVEQVNQIRRAREDLSEELEHEPTSEEIGNKLGIAPDRVEYFDKVSKETMSIDWIQRERGEEDYLGDSENPRPSRVFGDLDDNEDSYGFVTASLGILKEQIAEVLDSLTEREARVLQMRFGLEDGVSQTLEAVGIVFGVTRERIRQIEAKALRKLRHPTRSRKLKDFLEEPEDKINKSSLIDALDDSDTDPNEI